MTENLHYCIPYSPKLRAESLFHERAGDAGDAGPDAQDAVVPVRLQVLGRSTGVGKERGKRREKKCEGNRRRSNPDRASPGDPTDPRGTFEQI